jgi:hypothetical protein
MGFQELSRTVRDDGPGISIGEVTVPGDPDDVEERQSTVVELPLTGFDAAVRAGTVRDARTIAAVRLALS